MDFQRERIQENEVKRRRRICKFKARKFWPETTETTETGTSVAILTWLGWEVPDVRLYDDVIQNKYLGT